MQKLSEIRQLLASVGRRPRLGAGQHFLIDANLMSKLLELADLTGAETVLEVGAGTGSLTEELLRRADRVVAVEVDPVLAGLLRRRLGTNSRLTVLGCDALAGKHVIAPPVLEALAGRQNVHLVSNLPYSIAVPLVLNCLLVSWQAARFGAAAEDAERGASGVGTRDGAVCFRRLTFSVQRELLERLTAQPAGEGYGPASVIVALLARVTPGRMIPPESFWPRPKVQSQMLRLDFDARLAGRLADARMLSAVLSATFGQRRKKITAAARRKDLPFPGERFLRVLAGAGIDPSARPERVSPGGFLALANALGQSP